MLQKSWRRLGISKWRKKRTNVWNKNNLHLIACNSLYISKTLTYIWKVTCSEMWVVFYFIHRTAGTKLHITPLHWKDPFSFLLKKHSTLKDLGPIQMLFFSWAEPNTSNQVREKISTWINSECLFQFLRAQPFFAPCLAGNFDCGTTLEIWLWLRWKTFYQPNASL